MKVYVVMGNNYPDCVFRKLLDAEAYCASKRRENKLQGLGHRVYWMVYDFEVKEEFKP